MNVQSTGETIAGLSAAMCIVPLIIAFGVLALMKVVEGMGLK